VAVLRIAFATLLAVSVAVFAAIAGRALLYPHEIVVSEGAVRLATETWAQGRALWSPDRLTEAPFAIAHYTPLYYLLTRAVQAVTGEGFLAGRLVSVVFTVLTAIAAGWIARRETGRTWAGFVAGAVWLSFYAVAFWGTAHRVDAPGIFFEAVGIGAYLAARRAGRDGYDAIPWFVAAWCVKQVMFVGLVAVLVDLALDRNRGPLRAARYAAFAWGPILALFGLWTWWSDGGFWSATVLGTVSKDADTPWVVVSNAERFFGSPWSLATFLAGIAAAVFFPRRNFLGVYLLTGIVLAIVTDANFPRFFPPALAAAILIGILLADLEAHPRANEYALASLTLVLFAHLGWEMRPLVRERVLNLTPSNTRLDAAAWLRDRAPEGRPILAQDVGMLLSADRPVTVADPLVYSILVGNGAWDPEILAAGIREGAYGAVVLNRPVESLNDREWTTLWISGPARRALSERYRLLDTFTIGQSWVFLEPTRYLYVPKETP
jgi:hypothetical protein